MYGTSPTSPNLSIANFDGSGGTHSFTAAANQLCTVTDDGSTPNDVALPAATSSRGAMVVVRRDANSTAGLTVTPHAGDTIDGVGGAYAVAGTAMSGVSGATVEGSVTLVSNGVSDWAVLGETPVPALSLRESYLSFAGGITAQAAATVNGYLANTIPASTLSSTAAMQYPIVGIVQTLRVFVIQNDTTTNTTVQVYKDGVAVVGLSVTVGAGATGSFVVTSSQSFNAGIDVRVSNTNGGAGKTFQCSATVSLQG